MRGILVFVWLVVLGLVQGFGTSPKPAVAQQQCLDRRDLLGLALPGMALGSFGLSAQAKGASGTKDDPKYEGCLSSCLYYCTKPKGNEQKSRGECLPDCKKQCAKTDAQLMLGRPKV